MFAVCCSVELLKTINMVNTHDCTLPLFCVFIYSVFIVVYTIGQMYTRPFLCLFSQCLYCCLNENLRTNLFQIKTLKVWIYNEKVIDYIVLHTVFIAKSSFIP